MCFKVLKETAFAVHALAAVLWGSSGLPLCLPCSPFIIQPAAGLWAAATSQHLIAPGWLESLL